MAGTDFNIILGLCVGHDSLFIKYSKAMVSVFAVKDRVLGHNPLAAIYNYDSYYQRLKQDRLKVVTVKETVGASPASSQSNKEMSEQLTRGI